MGPLAKLVVAAAFLGGTFGTVVAAAAPAAAHAELASSNPAQGATVDTLPGTVELTFTEVVGSPSSVAVTGPGDKSVAEGDPEIVDGTLTQQVAADSAPAGAYAVSYRVTSADGHPISGTVTFNVGEPGSAAAAANDLSAAGGVGTGVVAGLVAALLAALGLVALSLRRLVPHARG